MIKLATSGSLEEMLKVVTKYLMGSTITFNEVEPEKEWSISNKNGLTKNFKIIKKGKRYYFYQEETKCK